VKVGDLVTQVTGTIEQIARSGGKGTIQVDQGNDFWDFTVPMEVLERLSIGLRVSITVRVEEDGST
jgi:hypothetical protein